jgi:hypothetical protein
MPDKAKRNWRIWNYDNVVLGEGCADTLGEAMKLARATWPAELSGNRLFDCVPGNQVNDPLIKLIQGRR